MCSSYYFTVVLLRKIRIRAIFCVRAVHVSLSWEQHVLLKFGIKVGLL